MNRFSILFHGLLAGVLLSAASPGRARGDEVGDNRLAEKLAAAASKSFEYDDAQGRYGVMAEIAQTMLQKREQRADLIVDIRNLNSVIALYPQNRRMWLVEQWAFYNQKLDGDRMVTVLDRQIEELDFQQQRIYEQELARARESKKAIRPIRREAILGELNRLDRECDVAVTELREGIAAAAREERTSRRKVWERIQRKLENLYPRPNVPDGALHEFVKRIDGLRWMDEGGEEGGAKAEPEKPIAGNDARRDVAARQADSQRPGNQVQDRVKVLLLRTVYSKLLEADHEYGGHRAKAMESVDQALRHLGSAAPKGPGGGPGSGMMARVRSDEIVRDALFKLRNLEGQLGKSGGAPQYVKTRASVAEAIRHLEVGLGTR
jgi:hypothetical protein